MSIHGLLKTVAEEKAGAVLTVAAPAGSTVLAVDDVADFDEDGGWLLLGTNVAEYLTCDDELATVTLAAPLAVAAPAVDGALPEVFVWDADAESVVVEYVAQVILDDQDEGDPVEAAIDHALVSMLPKRINVNGGWSVVMEWGDGQRGSLDDLHVTRVIGKETAIDGAYVANPFMSAYKTGTFAWPHNTWTEVLNWTIVRITDDITYDSTTGYFTISKPGVYGLSFGATFEADTTGSRAVCPFFLIDGIETPGRAVISAASTDPLNLSTAETNQNVDMMPGDKVRFKALQDSGGPLDLLLGSRRTTASIIRIAPA